MRRTALLICTLLLVGGSTAPAAAADDTTKPRIRITTEDGATRVGAPIEAIESEESQVAGVAKDLRGSGIKRVTVIYCANARRIAGGGYSCGTGALTPDAVTTVKARVTCRNTTKRRCTWTAAVPTQPGNYLVIAEARDRAGNRRQSGPVFITVV